MREVTDDCRPFGLAKPFAPDVSRADYLTSVARIRDYLLAGDCYQVNYAHRFSARLLGEPWRAYQSLRCAVRGEFAAYLALADGHAVLSLSPERFLSIAEGFVSTQPIKGTMPRDADPSRDAELAEMLRGSAKDHAENVMITDLLRNDLGRFCNAGSVQTPALCQLYSYSNVHHLVSTVTGGLSADVSPGQTLVGCSPGGSITGAPKRRAVEIIAELEPTPRGVYCGSVFTLTAGGICQSSIAIRTLELTGDELVCWGGGGITIDSDPAAEYQETLDKVGALLNALPVY